MLKIGTGGYTIVPNWALDALAEAGSNALALGTLLLRLIPGQSGEIVLAGPTSRRKLCAMLQWGTENSTKFDQALAEIEKTGLISTRIESGNSKIVCINGEIHRYSETQDSLNHAKQPINSTSAKIAPAKTNRPATAKIAPVPTDFEDISLLNNNIRNKTKLTHHRKNVANTTTLNDDEWAEIFLTYGRLFKTTVPPSQKTRFLESAKEGGLTPSDVKNRISELSAHPLLATKVTSINAIWHFQHLQKSARSFDLSVRQMLQALAQRHRDQTSFKAAICKVLKDDQNSHLDPERFMAYFAQDIANLKPVPVVANLDIEHTDEPANEPHNQTIAQMQTTYFELRSRSADLNDKSCENQLHERPLEETEHDLSNDESPKSQNPEPALRDHDKASMENHLNASYDLDPMSDETSKQSHNKTCLTEADCHQTSAIDVVTALNVLKMPVKPHLRNSSLTDDSMQQIVNSLLNARTKNDFLTKITCALEQTDLEELQKETLETLKDLTKIPNSTLDMLKSTIGRRFKFEKAS